MYPVHYAVAVTFVGTEPGLNAFILAHAGPASGAHVDIVPIAILLAAAALYLGGIQRLSLRGRKWSLWRTVPFIAGLVTIGVAIELPVLQAGSNPFTSHVVQHLALSMAGPALMCLGAPLTLLLQASSRSTQTFLLRALNSTIVKFFTHPIVSWMIFVTSLFVLYYSGLYELSLRNELAHEIMHAHFIASGFLFFAGVVAIDPHPWRMPHGLRLLYVGLTLPAHAFLALALMSARTPIAADFYLGIGRQLDDVLRDQKLGAGVMWIAGDLIAILTVGIVAKQWATQEDRVAGREDKIVDMARLRDLELN